MTIAIVSALPEEQHGLVDAMSGARHLRHAGRDFWLGQLHGAEVVCALCKAAPQIAACSRPP